MTKKHAKKKIPSLQCLHLRFSFQFGLRLMIKKGSENHVHPEPLFSHCYYSNVHKEYNLRLCFPPINHSHIWSKMNWSSPSRAGLVNPSIKSQTVNILILGFVGYMVSVATTQLCLHSSNAITIYKLMSMVAVF